ncbi:phosphatase PAP2 family protein [Chryseobacterium gotjawalense]|uniref:Phosphatase PAP2 family protein n=1 Tax=Chryseobacterium gotjawalense TaxID=3042315 RepID=A0ABY8R952_9FLAO|nr:phosphatase PAP2 family protein [Chryseobacterium sp. wdc7]WHF50371.1 phosphatase PAP2 family protein [Chryseobacterium sp. wdc7]
MILSIFMVFGAVVLFASIIHEIFLEKEQEDDLLIFEFFRTNIIRSGLTRYMIDVTNLCSPVFVKIAFPVLIAVLLIFKYYRKAAFTFLAGIGGLVLIGLAKVLFRRPRPHYPLEFPETGYSFPSGHATFSFIFYGTLAYFVWLSRIPKALKLFLMFFLMLLSLSIGISRIYLRVHYPSDVAAGFCLGYSWLFLLIYYFRLKYPIG